MIHGSSLLGRPLAAVSILVPVVHVDVQIVTFDGRADNVVGVYDKTDEGLLKWTAFSKCDTTVIFNGASTGADAAGIDAPITVTAPTSPCGHVPAVIPDTRTEVLAELLPVGAELVEQSNLHDGFSAHLTRQLPYFTVYHEQ